MPIYPDPLRMARAVNGGAASWYRIEAKADDVAEVMIYDTIAWWGITARKFVDDLKSVKAATIKLRVNSPGGDVFDGLAIYNALKDHPARVEVRIEGLAASMASVIALAGDVVQIHEAAFFMIHNPWAFAIGDSAEMRKVADQLDKIAGPIRAIYSRKSKKTTEDITALMDAETWYTGTEAVEAGFADALVEADEGGAAAAAARYDLSAFRHPPAAYVTTETAPSPVAAQEEAAPAAPAVAAEETPALDPRVDDTRRRRLDLQAEKLRTESR